MSFNRFGRVALCICLPLWLGGAALHGGMRVAPEEAMRAVFGSGCDVAKRTLVLSKEEAAKAESMAKMRLNTRLYSLFTASLGGKVTGYGMLVSRKVRSKSAAVLYAITPSGKVAAIEIVAFNEPPEFIPPAPWLAQFEGADAQSDLAVGKAIPTITGATLSARSLTHSARLALAIYEIKVKP